MEFKTTGKKADTNQLYLIHEREKAADELITKYNNQVAAMLDNLR